MRSENKLTPGAARRQAATGRQTIDLHRYFPAFMTRLANKWARPASLALRRDFGIGINEWRVMVLLAVEEGITAARVCGFIGLDKAVVSRSVQLMADKGLVDIRPDPRDSRQRLISLSEAGWDVHDRAMAVALDLEREVLSCLDPEEREVLFGMLQRLLANIETLGDPTAR